VVTGKTQAMLGIQHDGTKNRVVLRLDDRQKILSETTSNNITLRVEIQDGGMCSFGFAENGGFVSIPQRFQARKGTWIGAKLGLYSLKQVQSFPAGHVDVDYFRFR